MRLDGREGRTQVVVILEFDGKFILEDYISLQIVLVDRVQPNTSNWCSDMLKQNNSQISMHVSVCPFACGTILVSKVNFNILELSCKHLFIFVLVDLGNLAVSPHNSILRHPLSFFFI